MSDLITLNEYKTAKGIALTDTSQDAEITQAITWASAIVRNYTDRDFGTTPVTEQRIYPYDGSGILEIDDATAITDVTLSAPPAADLPLTTDEWFAAPSNAPVFSYIYVAMVGPGYMDPLMGFHKNYDVLWREGRYRFAPPQIKVTATFGWLVVPDDVKMAMVWTIEDWQARKEGEGLTSESIADYSRSWGRQGAALGARPQALPDRAMDVLANYQKLYV